MYAVPRGGFKGGSEISAPPCGPKKVQDKAATCQNFLHYILTNEFACVYVFIFDISDYIPGSSARKY